MDKKCNKCQIIKSIDRFAPHSCNKKVIRHICRDCYNEQSKNTRDRINEEEYFRRFKENQYYLKKCKIHGILEYKNIFLEIHTEHNPLVVHLRCVQCLSENKQRKFNNDNYEINLSNRLINCRKCKENKYFFDFYNSEIKRKSPICISCLRLNGAKYRKKSALKTKYNITVEEYDSLLKKQNYLCAICFNPEVRVHRITQTVTDLSVDHCHKTGKVRGLLCRLCNIMLGNSMESKEILLNGIKYLEKHEKT